MFKPFRDKFFLKKEFLDECTKNFKKFIHNNNEFNMAKVNKKIFKSNNKF